MYKITTELNTAASLISVSGKTPWVIVSDTEVLAVFAGRNEARVTKTEKNIVGKIVKISDIKIELCETKATKVRAAVAKAVSGDELLRASVVESPCWLVWDTADNMPGARRKDVIAACVAKGVAYYTARTQYQLWLTAHRNAGE